MRNILWLVFILLGINNIKAQTPADSMLIQPASPMTMQKAVLPLKTKPSISIFPNPAKFKAFVEVKGMEKGLVKLRITDSGGTVLREEERFLYSGGERIAIMFSLEPGLYYLTLKQGTQVLRSKLLVQ